MSDDKQEKIDFLSVITEDVRGSIIDMFGDNAGDAWVYYNDGSEKRFYSAHGGPFEDFIRVKIYDWYGKPHEAWVKQISSLIGSESRRAGTKDLGVRWIIDEQGNWVYQLGQNDTLIISDKGLERVETKPLFRHYPEQKAMDVDMTATLEDINLLDEFFNFKSSAEYMLFKSTLPALLVPEIAKPVMMFRGPPGSAKSTACRLIKMLLDPVSGMEVGSQYITKSDHLFVTCLRNQVIISDNVQDPTPSQQDTMSRLSTGLNISARKLYTNSEMVNGMFRRIQLVNGIQFTNLQADLVDRALIWELDRVADGERMFESELFARYEKMLPKIRGALFKALFRMRGINIADNVDLRLVDFARYAVKSGIAYGYEEDFIKLQLAAKVELQQEDALQASMVAEVLAIWLHGKSTWEGTPASLYEELTKAVRGSLGEGMVNRINPKDWYENTSTMMKHLYLVAHNLKFFGWEMKSGRTKKERRIKFVPYERTVLIENMSDAQRFDRAKELIIEMSIDQHTVTEAELLEKTGIIGKRVIEAMLRDGELMLISSESGKVRYKLKIHG